VAQHSRRHDRRDRSPGESTHGSSPPPTNVSRPGYADQTRRSSTGDRYRPRVRVALTGVAVWGGPDHGTDDFDAAGVRRPDQGPVPADELVRRHLGELTAAEVKAAQADVVGSEQHDHRAYGRPAEHVTGEPREGLLAGRARRVGEQRVPVDAGVEHASRCAGRDQSLRQLVRVAVVGAGRGAEPSVMESPKATTVLPSALIISVVWAASAISFLVNVWK
jgi:hypothetical protein